MFSPVRYSSAAVSRHPDLVYMALQLGWINCLEDAFADRARIYRGGGRVAHPRNAKRPRHPLQEAELNCSSPFVVAHCLGGGGEAASGFASGAAGEAGGGGAFKLTHTKPVRESDTRFLVALLFIECEETDISHTNALVFDYERRILYRFEPNGAFHARTDAELEARSAQDACFSRMYHFTNNALEGFADRCGLHYVSPLDLCGDYVNIMGRVWDALPEEHVEEGMCGAMSLLFIHCVLLNPDMDVQELVESFFVERNPLALYADLCHYGHSVVLAASLSEPRS